MNKMTGWEWDHAKIVADRCAERYSTLEEVKQNLLEIGWPPEQVDQMMSYLRRKRRAETK
nr:MAG TPA: hypothetical protein [Caudoviricetes sp.]